MLQAYKFYSSDHSKLHDFIMIYFENIATHRTAFVDSLIPNDFITIAKTHKKVIYDRLIFIHSELLKLDADVQKKFCNQVVSSNKIEEICQRKTTPLKLENVPDPIRDTVNSLFLSLYSQILRGNNSYSKKYGTIKQHFDGFRKDNSAITICPFCGIMELKTEFDKTLEQYDHYLTKSIYPFSTVNFFNLVPTCKDCNSFDFKGDKDTLEQSKNRVFYPYNTNAYQIEISFTVTKNPDINDWEWVAQITNPDGSLSEEIESWDEIYNIKERFTGHIKGRITKWISFYYEYKRKAALRGKSDQEILEDFVSFIEIEEQFGLNFLRKPGFNTWLNA